MKKDNPSVSRKSIKVATIRGLRDLVFCFVVFLSGWGVAGRIQTKDSNGNWVAG